MTDVLSAVHRAEKATERTALSYKFVDLFYNGGIESLTGDPDKCYVGQLSYGGKGGIIVQHILFRDSSGESWSDLITIKGPLSLPILGNKISPLEGTLDFSELSFEGWEITLTPATNG